MSTLDLAAMVIDRLPLSPKERFAFGAALIVDVVDACNEKHPTQSPFLEIKVDNESESSILKGAAAALLAVESLPDDHPMSLKVAD
jgi:hypothetical protein